ncbi:hypothetical protein, partial [Allobaculum mucilyticum]|uniref:hypothetical protein n=1 Tax=Allobaculum mucilyticum TaxID=2834459 RepID=UPI001E432082
MRERKPSSGKDANSAELFFLRMLPKERFSVVRNAVKTGGTSISIWSINEIQSSPTAKLVAVPSRITRAIR